MTGGLLDFLRTPEGQGLLSAGFGAAAGARPGQPWNTLGRGGLAGLAGYSQALDRKSEEEQRGLLAQDRAQMRDMRDLQMGQMRNDLNQQKAQQEWRAGLPVVMNQTKPQTYDMVDVLGDGSGVGQASTPGNPQALNDYLRLPNSPFADKILEQQLFPKAADYKTVGNTMIRIGPNGEVIPVFTEAPKPTSPTSAMQEYEYAVGQGYKGTFDQYQKELRKSGASNTNVNVNATKPFINEFAGGMGKAMSDARTNAQGAVSTISTVERLNEALDAGIMAGPGTSFRQFGLQIGSMLGVTGKDAEEKLLNTRQTIQSLAQLELDAAQQMKGQGQITEAERGIIRRAASGDIDSLTAPELRLLGNVLDRVARSKIDAYNAQVDPLMRAPETRGIAPFLRVEPPPIRQPKTRPTTGMPQVGAIQGGYRFKGGDPADRNNWELAR